MINVGIYGVTGYAGYELLRWLGRHRDVRVIFTASESQSGKQLSEIFPGPLEARLIAPDDAPLGDVDVVFLGLPHGAAAKTAVRALDAGVRVIDLSADFRLATPAAYTQWYGHEHPAPDLLPAAYGLVELNREQIRSARLVANPGCYPTTVVLGLAPLLQAGLVSDPTIIVDSKSGISGAGRPPKQNTSFVEVNESLSAYNIGRVHRHVGEMEQEAAKLTTGTAPQIIFTPHLLPISRGMLSSIYIRVPETLSEAAARELFLQHYANEPFVRVLPAGQLAAIAHTSNTNLATISVTLAKPGLLIILSSLDNLVKGAAGQAIQNMNVMFSLEETEGLR
ncbi:MAG: N-acetyl-gamma-glutamyl-phosphate reductase [Roseiflexaceae bacterium]|nr:N-acetyl-gamma-glutamyl-phosphate reductase [Roseiflexaceae bacterium]